MAAGGPTRDVAGIIGGLGGNHDESAAELLQDSSEPKLANESQLGVCRELLIEARQQQKPLLNAGNSTTTARQHSWEAADVHMQSSQTVPELDAYDETWDGDDVDDHGSKLTKHFYLQTACWTSPTSQRSLTRKRVGVRRRLGCQTLAAVMT